MCIRFLLQSMPYHYLDHISRTPLAPEALEAMQPWWQDRVGTSGGVHRACVATRNALECAREQAAALLGLDSPESILWTSSGAEAVVTGLGAIPKAARSGSRLLTTRVERPELLKAALRLHDQEGVALDYAPVDSDGRVDVAGLRALAGPDTFMIATHLAHHDSGVLQPIEEIVGVARACGARLFIDGTTAVGWTPVDLRRLPIDYLAFAPYRFYGPVGIGGLVVRSGAPFRPLIVGGDQEWERRAGAENVPGIVGAGVACALAAERMDERVERVRASRLRFHGGVRTALEGWRLVGPDLAQDRLPHHLSYSFPGLEGEGIALLCDVRGVGLHSLTACAARDLEPSHSLMGMGYDKHEALSSVVLGFGEEASESDVDQAASVFIGVVRRLRSI